MRLYMKRMDMKCFLPLSLMLFTFASCSKSYQVEGKSSITSLDGKMLYIKSMQDNGQWLAIDSSEVVHGLFSMKGKADTAQMATLYMGDESILPFILERGKVTVTISNARLEARGTPLNDALYDFIDKHRQFQIDIDELQSREARMVLEGANIDDIHDGLTQEAEKMADDMNSYINAFIAENYDNPLGPTAFMLLCNSFPYPVMTSQIEDIMRTASMKFKENAFVKDYLEKAKENMRRIEENNRLQQNMSATARQR